MIEVVPAHNRKIDYEKAAILKSQGLTYNEVAAQLGVNAESMKVGFHRKGINTLTSNDRRIRVQKATLVLDALQSRSDAIRETFATTLGKHASALDKVAVKPNLKHLRQVGEALEPLARTAKVVFDWGSDKPTGVIVVGAMDRSDSVDCGADTPTPSVPEPSAISETNTSSQPIDVEELGSS